MTETHPDIAVDRLTDKNADDATSRVSTVLISENPLLQAGMEHLLSGTRFIVTRSFLVNRPSESTMADASLIIFVTKQCYNAIVETIAGVRSKLPGSKICVMADELDIGSAVRAYEAGANGFCLTSAEQKVLTTSLDLIMMGEGIVPSRLLLSTFDHPATHLDHVEQRTSIGSDQVQESIRAAGPTGQRLSAREGEILRGLMEGAPNKVIARQFGLSEATVKVHVKAILRKIGAKNRTQAAMWAADHIPPSRVTNFS
jgi:two-component system nitrate/nitrite response regulator NarL